VTSNRLHLCCYHPMSALN